MVTSSSVDEKRSTSKTRLMTQRSVGTEKAESKPKSKESDDSPKVAEQPGPFLLLSQVHKGTLNGTNLET
jgi:hypothetical protein